MRWKRRRSSLRFWSARCERAESPSRSASRTSSEAASVVSGERSSWLTSELKRASRSIRSCSWSTMALKELVRPSRSGSAASASRRVSSSPAGDGAGGPGHRGERAQAAGAGEAPEGGAEDGRDDAGDEERQPEDAQRVVEVGEVEHLEVVGLDGGDRDPDHDLRRPLRRAVGLGGRGAGQHDRAQLAGDGGRVDRQGGRVGLGAVVEHRVRVRSRRRCWRGSRRRSRWCPVSSEVRITTALAKAWCWAADSRPASRKWRVVK